MFHIVKKLDIKDFIYNHVWKVSTVMMCETHLGGMCDVHLGMMFQDVWDTPGVMCQDVCDTPRGDVWRCVKYTYEPCVKMCDIYLGCSQGCCICMWLRCVLSVCNVFFLIKNTVKRNSNFDQSLRSLIKQNYFNKSPSLDFISTM